MQKNLLTTSLLSLTLASSLYASENYIEIGGGVSNTKDNFSTDSKSNLNSLNNSADSESEAMPYVEFFYGYDLNSDNTIYLESKHGDLKLGNSISTDMGEFDYGLVYSMLGEETWENPFQTSGNRKETDVSEFGGYISYGIPLTENSFTNFTYQYTTVDYDKETVISQLRREGKRHLLSVENEIEDYMVNFNYELYDADGEQSSYKHYAFEVGKIFKLNEQLSLYTMAGLGMKKYDETNSILNKKIDATTYSAIASLRYEKPFDWNNTYTTLKVGIENEEANHNFYDKENNFAIVTIGYKF